jgi:hypothetical protein
MDSQSFDTVVAEWGSGEKTGSASTVTGIENGTITVDAAPSPFVYLTWPKPEPPCEEPNPMSALLTWLSRCSAIDVMRRQS